MTGKFREGPTKHIDSLNEMITVALALNRTFVEPCYRKNGVLYPCQDIKEMIPFCQVFSCENLDDTTLMPYSVFRNLQNFSTAEWLSGI